MPHSKASEPSSQRRTKPSQSASVDKAYGKAKKRMSESSKVKLSPPKKGKRPTKQ